MWSLDSLELVTPSCRLRGVHENAVTSVAFSPDGERLLSAGLDTMHSVAVWDWRQGTILIRQASSPRPLLGLGFLHGGRPPPRAPPPADAPTAVAAAIATEATDVTDATENEAGVVVGTGGVVDGGGDGDGDGVDGASAGAGGSGERIVVCGERELRFGEAPSRASGRLRWRKAVFGRDAELQTLPCVAVNTDGRILTGTMIAV